MSGEIVSVRASDGVRLDGMFRKPEASGGNGMPVDVMLLHHGVGGNFYGSSPFESFSPWLLENGCATLRVNNRGHDAVSNAVRDGVRTPFGAAYEIIDDARMDWNAWLDHAEAQGYERIGVWGHSLGAVKSIYHAAVERDPRVTCVIAGSPPRFSYSHYAGVESWGDIEDAGKRFAETAALAMSYVEKGEPEQLIKVEFPVPLLVSAGTYIDKYGPAELYDVVTRIPEVTAPLFCVIGTAEPLEQFPFWGLPEEMQRLHGEVENFTFAYVEGANHSYSEHRGEVWDVTEAWLRGL